MRNYKEKEVYLFDFDEMCSDESGNYSPHGNEDANEILAAFFKRVKAVKTHYSVSTWKHTYEAVAYGDVIENYCMHMRGAYNVRARWLLEGGKTQLVVAVSHHDAISYFVIKKISLNRAKELFYF